MTFEDVLQLIKGELKKNFNSGTPQIAPHQHDGVDNLKLNPIDFLGYPIFRVTNASTAPLDQTISGIFRFQYDGTNLTMWFRNGRVWAQIGGGGGGGTPGGSDTEVQYNDSGTFAGDAGFKYIQADGAVQAQIFRSEGGGDTLLIGGDDSDRAIEIEASGAGMGVTITGGTGAAGGGDITLNSGDNAGTGTPCQLTLIGAGTGGQADVSVSPGLNNANVRGNLAVLAGGLRVENDTINTGVADSVIYYSSDVTAGNTIPTFRTEGSGVVLTGQADSTSATRVRVRINGTLVTLLAI